MCKAFLGGGGRMAGTDFIVCRCPVSLDWEATSATGETLFQSCSYPVALSTVVQIEFSTHPVPLQHNDLLDSPPSSFRSEVATNCPVHLSHSPFWPWWFFSVLALLSCKMCSPFCCATWVPY